MKKTTSLSQKIEYLLVITVLIASYVFIMTEYTARMFWPYMLCTLVLAVGVYFARPPKRPVSLKEYLFSPKIWLHPSAVNDYKLFIFNYFIYFHFFALLILSEPVFLKDWITWALGALEFQQTSEEPGIVAALTLTISALLLSELTYYIQHRAKHEIPFLWELHKVHHSAEVMTPITFIRGHPTDLLFENCIKIFVITLCSSVFMYFYPNKDGFITVAGIDAGLFIFYIIGGNLHHSHVWLSYGKTLEHVLISPAQHQIHHSNNPKHFDKNYGSMLAIWDWMFGSLYIPEKEEEITFGLPEKEKKNYDTTTKLLWHPMKEMFLMLIGKRKGLKKTL